MSRHLAEKGHDGNSHQDDEQQHGAADPYAGIREKYGPAMTQPVEKSTRIDNATPAVKRGRDKGKFRSFTHGAMLTGPSLGSKAQTLQKARKIIGILDRHHFAGTGLMPNLQTQEPETQGGRTPQG